MCGYLAVRSEEIANEVERDIHHNYTKFCPFMKTKQHYALSVLLSASL